MVSADVGPTRACKSHSVKSYFQIFQNVCRKINYNIQYSKYGKSCELYLQGTISTSLASEEEHYSSVRIIDAYRIVISPCPVGFVLDEITEMCHCDPVLEIFNVCIIDDQTVQRPCS